MSEDEPEDKTKKGKKDKKPEDVEKSPDPADEGLVRWIIKLFRDGERADWISATQIFGKSKNLTRGEVLRRIPIPAGDFAPEKMVALANELHEEMQHEADTFHQTRYFVIEAWRQSKSGGPGQSGPFAQRAMEIEPRRASSLLGGALALRGAESLASLGTSEDGEDENPYVRAGGDLLRGRTGDVLKDARIERQQTFQMFGGMMSFAMDVITELRNEVREARGAWIEATKAREIAESGALDRELIRKERQFVLDAKLEGVKLLKNLLPGVVTRIAKGEAGATGGGNGAGGGGSGKVDLSVVEKPTDQAVETARTPESLKIERVLSDLSDKEKTEIFGVWTSAGTRTVVGILTEAQVRIIVDVLRGERGPEAIDALIDESSPDRVTEGQLGRVAAAAEVHKLVPLLQIINDHKEALAKNKSSAN